MLYKPRNIRKSQFLGSSDAVTASVTAELLTWCFLFFSWLYRSFFGGSMVTDIFGGRCRVSIVTQIASNWQRISILTSIFSLCFCHHSSPIWDLSSCLYTVAGPK